MAHTSRSVAGRVIPVSTVCRAWCVQTTMCAAGVLILAVFADMDCDPIQPAAGVRPVPPLAPPRRPLACMCCRVLLAPCLLPRPDGSRHAAQPVSALECIVSWRACAQTPLRADSGCEYERLRAPHAADQVLPYFALTEGPPAPSPLPTLNPQPSTLAGCPVLARVARLLKHRVSAENFGCPCAQPVVPHALFNTFALSMLSPCCRNPASRSVSV